MREDASHSDRSARAPEETAASEPLFRRDGEWLVPTELSQGPWNPEHQHGGAVAAVLCRVLEQHALPVPMRPTRIVFDLMHPAPLQPLRTEVRAVRAGRRVALLDAALLHGERAVARASALMLRVDPDAGLEDVAGGPPARRLEATPEAGADVVAAFGREKRTDRLVYVPGFLRAIDFRRIDPEPRTGEPSRAWIRLRAPVVGGEDDTPLVRLAAAADFTSALGVEIDFSRFVAINPDVTLHVERLPEGEWIGVETVSRVGPDGIGSSAGTLHDLGGPVARAHTSLYVAARGR